MVLAQQFYGMAEADALGVHYPGDYVASLVARPEAVPEILFRADHQARLMVIVERTQPEQVRAVAFELDASRFGESLQRDLLLQPLDHFIRDASHSKTSSKRSTRENLSSSVYAILIVAYESFRGKHGCAHLLP